MAIAGVHAPAICTPRSQLDSATVAVNGEISNYELASEALHGDSFVWALNWKLTIGRAVAIVTVGLSNRLDAGL